MNDITRYGKEVDTLRAFLDCVEAPKCVHNLIMDRIRWLDSAALDLELTVRAGQRWDENDEKIVFDAMDGWTAKTYHDADEKMLELAYKLKRPVTTVKKKLRACGWGPVLDAWYKP